MDETTPDATPLSQHFLRSLANFMEQEHQPLGEGDISPQVKGAIAEAQAATAGAASNAAGASPENHKSEPR